MALMKLEYISSSSSMSMLLEVAVEAWCKLEVEVCLV